MGEKYGNPMNSKQLFHALYHNKITNPFFDGIFASDQLENIVLKPRLLIANTQPAHLSGEHWIAFFFEGNQVDVFDSLGKELLSYPSARFDMLNFVKRFASVCKSPKYRTQPPNSNICGQMCLYFAYYRTLGYSLDMILEKMQNIQMVLRFIRKQFKITDSKNGIFVQCSEQN